MATRRERSDRMGGRQLNVMATEVKRTNRPDRSLTGG